MHPWHQARLRSQSNWWQIDCLVAYGTLNSLHVKSRDGRPCVWWCWNSLTGINKWCYRFTHRSGCTTVTASIYVYNHQNPPYCMVFDRTLTWVQEISFGAQVYGHPSEGATNEADGQRRLELKGEVDGETGILHGQITVVGHISSCLKNVRHMHKSKWHMVAWYFPWQSFVGLGVAAHPPVEIWYPQVCWKCLFVKDTDENFWGPEFRDIPMQHKGISYL